MFSKNFQRKYALTDQGLRNVREIRAANQEARYLEGLNQKIDEHETVTIRGELGTGIFVNAASVIMRLGVAATILVGPGVRALRPEPGTHRGDVRLPGVCRPHQRDL